MHQRKKATKVYDILTIACPPGPVPLRKDFVNSDGSTFGRGGICFTRGTGELENHLEQRHWPQMALMALPGIGIAVLLNIMRYVICDSRSRPQVIDSFRW